MSLLKFNPRTAILLVFILVIGIIRVLFNFTPVFSPASNFSPLGAMALFGGAYFDRRWKALAFPLLTLFISDMVLHLTVYHKYGNGILYGGWYWVYGAFAIMTLVGRSFLKKVTVSHFVAAAFICVLIHWIVTDFAVWKGSIIYAQTFGGYLNCLVAAIPFEWHFLAGTLVYGAILFGVFERVQRKYPIVQTQRH